MIDLSEFLNRPLFIWVKCFVVDELLIVGISRFTAPEWITNIEILFVKTFSPKQKLNQIISATIEKMKFLSIKR